MSRERSREDILALGVMNSELDAHIKEHGEPPRPSMDVNVAREMMAKNQKARIMQIPVPEAVVEEDIVVHARDGYDIPCRIHRPRGNPGGPLIIMFHAGGFVAGGPFQEFAACRRYVKEHDAVCVNVDYRLAPEHKFPVAVDDAFDVITWASLIKHQKIDQKKKARIADRVVLQAAENSNRLGADPKQGFLLAGTSAGANLSNVCAHLAKEKGMSPPLTGISLAVPITIAADAPPERYRDDYLSWEQNKDSIWLNRESIVNMARHYAPDRNSRLYASIHDNHKGLPRVYIQACGCDPFRDDALIYEKMLRLEAGVETKIDIYPGVPHGFWPIWPNLEISKKCIQDNTKGIAWLLRKNS